MAYFRRRCVGNSLDKFARFQSYLIALEVESFLVIVIKSVLSNHMSENTFLCVSRAGIILIIIRQLCFMIVSEFMPHLFLEFYQTPLGCENR